MKNCGVIIQARLESQRLPGKIIRPFYRGLSILDLVVIRLKKARFQGPIILATGDIDKNKALEGIADKLELKFFSGSENDVLSRFIQCSKQFNLKKIVRVCCDNPFLDIDLLNDMLNHEEDCDYLSYRVNENPAILSHYGFFVEIISLAGLMHIQSEDKIDALDKEHVTRYVYTNPQEFSIEYLKCPPEIEQARDIRLTVDTETDFENAQLVISKMLNGSGDFNYGYKDVLRVAKEIPALSTSMKNEITKNSK